MPAIGDVLGGKLRIEHFLGEGAMGIVYAARDEGLGRRVAVKVLAAHLAGDPEHRRRFDREARAVAKLTSPHVVHILEVGQTDDGTPWYAMEYLAGRSLMKVVEDEGPLPVAKAVGFVVEALDVLAEAHAAGLVHRDLKPENLFLTDAKTIKVLDFGVVKDLASLTAVQTKTGDALGTPAYMAPEQARTGEPVDARTDIWAVGVTLYELLTGEIPFRGDSIAKVLTGVLEDPPAPMSRPDVPAELEAIVTRCLAKSKDERFGSARELADALAPFGPAAVPPPIAQAAAPRRKTSRAESRRPAAAPPTRRGVRAFAISFGAVSALAAIGLALFVRGRRPTAASVDMPSAAPSFAAMPSITTLATVEPPPTPEPVETASVEPPPGPRAPRPPKTAGATPKMLIVKEPRTAPLQGWLQTHRAELTTCAPVLHCGVVLDVTVGRTQRTVRPSTAAWVVNGSTFASAKTCERTDSRPIADCVRRILASAPTPPENEDAQFALFWEQQR